MRKQNLKIIAFMLVLCTILSTNMTAFGYVKSESKLLKQKDVLTYINSAVTIENTVVLDQPVTYYHGDNYTVVEEIYGYTLITEDENGIYANGELVTYKEKTAKSLDLLKNSTSSSDWAYVDTDNYKVSIGGLTVAAVSILISRKSPDIPKTYLDDIIVFLGGIVIAGLIPDLWVFNLKVVTYIRIEDPFIGLVSYKYNRTFTPGPVGNESMYKSSWTTYNYNTVI